MYTIWKHPEAFTIANSKDKNAIRIDRNSGEIALSKEQPTAGQPVSAILGIIQLRVTKYLVVASTASRAGDILGHEVYRLSGFQLLPFRATNLPVPVEADFLRLLEQHLATAPLYFSPTYDLTNSMQRHHDIDPGRSLLPHETADERFFWNSFIAKPLIEAAKTHAAVASFINVAIFGVYHVSHCTTFGSTVKFGLISRRSCHRAGTRYFRRGLDEVGNAANFNETEQLLFVSNRVYSYVQTRGSVPAFWGEVNHMTYKPTLVVGGPGIDAARRHFEQQKKLYGEQFLVNLVNQSGYEKPIKDVYEQVVDGLADPELHYTYFDFHHECSKMRWHRVYLLIDELERGGLDKQGWFCAVDGKPVARQSSVVRTNCMDCLDRTNVVQSCLGSRALQQQLQDAGVVQTGTKWEQGEQLLGLFRTVWADNADGVSRAYSGTPALKTDFTRTGKRTFVGALNDLNNSISRYYLNNLRDGSRQDSYNLFLGNYSPFEHVQSPFVDRRDLSTRSVPYFFGFSVFLFLFSVFFPSPTHSRTFNLGVSAVFLLLSFGTYKYILINGLQYVNWPKLLPTDYVRTAETPTFHYVQTTGSHSIKND